MIDVSELNSRTILGDYNCGGFALCLDEWYCPDSYDAGDPDIEEMLEKCAEDILKDFPELSRVSHYSGIPDDKDIIGFRLGEEYSYGHYTEEGYWEEDQTLDDGMEILVVDDFHFVLRSSGIWYHKPGSLEVGEVDFDIDDEWPHNTSTYSSKIIWFMRDHVEIYPERYSYSEEEDY